MNVLNRGTPLPLLRGGWRSGDRQTAIDSAIEAALANARHCLNDRPIDRNVVLLLQRRALPLPGNPLLAHSVPYGSFWPHPPHHAAVRVHQEEKIQKREMVKGINTAALPIH